MTAGAIAFEGRELVGLPAGAADRAGHQVPVPLEHQLVDAAQDVIIVEQDCNTLNGIEMNFFPPFLRTWLNW